MPDVLTSELDAFITFVDDTCGGDLCDARVQKRYEPFKLIVETPPPDASMSPFSDDYVQSQLALYREISGREFDQWSGELHRVDIDALVDAPNPNGITDVTHVAENVRAVTAMVSMLGLGAHAPVLDLGAGHGLSSEVYAFCGAQVHAVDIDPVLTALSRLRAAKRSVAVTRSVLNFDSLDAIEDGAYAAALFFQSLHRALRPWQLIAALKQKLWIDGVIAFCGEPILDDPWKHWGLRLDIASVYAARKFGWFETAWSRPFITDCFARNGLTLTLFGGGHEGGFIGVATMDGGRQRAIVNRAMQLGHGVPNGFEDAALRRFYSQIGVVTGSSSRLGGFIRSSAVHSGGFLCFGPYAPLSAGRYSVAFLLTLVVESAPCASPAAASSIVFDVVSDVGRSIHSSRTLRVDPSDSTVWVKIEFELPSDVRQIETRAWVIENNVVWEMSLPTITRTGCLESEA